MSPEPTPFIMTSIASNLLPRLRRTHQRRRIAVFAGPPGIGKSTTLEAFQAEDPHSVAIITAPPGPKGGLRPAATLQLAIEALSDLLGSAFYSRIPTSYAELRPHLFCLVCEWAGLKPSEVRRDGIRSEDFGPLTLIIDEAQNLAQDGIEVLRFFSDARSGFSPLPLGLVFVGNNEFVLKGDKRGQSVLSAAVADRALYVETFEYPDVTDRDVTLFFEAKGFTDPEALKLAVRYFGHKRMDRSLRRAADLLADLQDEAAGEPITVATVRNILAAT